MAVDPVVGEGVLAFRRDWAVDELLAETFFDTWVVGRIYQYHAVLVEQTLVAFFDDEITKIVFDFVCAQAPERHSIGSDRGTTLLGEG